MADLGYSDAAHLRFAREFFFFLRLARVVEELRRKCDLEREQAVLSDPDGQLDSPSANNTITGVKLGANTDEKGRIYIRITGAGPYDYDAYSSTGGTGLVASVNGVAAGAVATLTEENSSGLTITLDSASGVGTTTADELYVECYLDAKKELLTIWPSDGTTDEDTASRAAAERMLVSLTQNCNTMLARIVQGASEWALGSAQNPVGRAVRFLKNNQSALWNEERISDQSGNVDRAISGILNVWKQAQADETTGSTQDIIQRVVARSAATFDSNNDGQGTLSSGSSDDRCPIGRWNFVCDFGLGNNRGGTEEFSGTFVADETDETFSFTGLRIGQTWRGPRGFGEITVTRSLTKTGDGSNADVGAASTFSVVGESETNTDGGVLYGKVDANGPNWDISFYSDSSRTTLVAKATNVATSASSVEASPQGSSGLTVTFDVGSGPTDTNTFSIDLNYFNTSNSTGQADSFYVTTSETSSGVAQRLLGLIFQAELNGDTSGSELISDDTAAKASTFVERMKIDI